MSGKFASPNKWRHLGGVLFVHDASDLCFQPQCGLVLSHAFGNRCSGLEAQLGQAVPAGARLQIAQQIWVQGCFRYRSDAMLAGLRGQADMQRHLARRLQEAVGFAPGIANQARGDHIKHF